LLLFTEESFVFSSKIHKLENKTRTIIIFPILYGYETWSLAYRKYTSVFKDRVLQNIIGPTTEKATEGWGRLLNEELQYPYQMLLGW
jgi:hypothetical protein